MFYAEGDGLIGAYEASVRTAPTGVGVAAVSRYPDGVALEASGTVRAEVLQGATGLELRGEVDAPEVGFSFQGPMHFSCSVPHELLPGSPAPLVPDDPAIGPVLITDTKLETTFCRDFMLGRRPSGRRAPPALVVTSTASAPSPSRIRGAGTGWYER